MNGDPTPPLSSKDVAICSALREALRNLLERYVDLANSGDCGFWDPEKEGVVAQSRAALCLAGAASYSVAPGDCKHAQALVVCPDCGVNLRGNVTQPFETFDDLGAQIYALLVRRGYAQHEAHLIASGPGCTSDCVQKGYPDIECPEHGARAVKANEQLYRLRPLCICDNALTNQNPACPIHGSSSNGKGNQV